MVIVFKRVILIAIAIVLIVAMTACQKKAQGGGDGNQETAKTSAELSQQDLDALMQQVADQEGQKSYEKYLPDQDFANAEVFGIDRDGDAGIAYVYLNCEEYVALKGKAYEMSGSAGEAIIRFDYTKGGPKLSKVEWSADGEEHEGWIKKNFPKEYLKQHQAYEAYDKEGRSVLSLQLQSAVEKALGVPVEQDNLLNIDTEKGTYEIEKVINSEECDTFDTETVEKGKLSDL